MNKKNNLKNEDNVFIISIYKNIKKYFYERSMFAYTCKMKTSFEIKYYKLSINSGSI